MTLSTEPLGRGVPASGRSNATHRPLLRRWLVGGGLLLTFLLGGTILAAGIGLELELQEALFGLAVALIPVAIVVPAFLWLDRHEAEPGSSLLVAFAWGALVATAISLVVNALAAQALWLLGFDPDIGTTVMVAPVIEEITKGLGIVVVWLMRRKEFDGVLDGIVYAGIVAAGFAFAENILYLGRALAEGGAEALAIVFVLRGLLSPFAHPLFTIWIGIGIGVLVEGRTLTRMLAPLGGLVLAIVLHSLWNAGAVAAGWFAWIGSYLLVQVPVFVATVIFIMWVRQREARAVRGHLEHYARHGLLDRQDLAMLSEARHRTAARAWAKSRGGGAAGRAMQDFQDDAIELAYLRARYLRGHAGPAVAEEERRLVDSLLVARRGVASAVGGRR